MRRFILAVLLCLPGIAAAAAGLTAAMPDIHNGATIPMVHVFSGCGGGNQSPALSWSVDPKGTQSFAVTIFDPDAPTGSGWWHWTVFNIPASVHSLPENAGAANSTALPAGAVQGRTDFGFSNYGGPCPPKGDRPHRYIFTIHALKVDHVDADQDAGGALAGFMINANQIGKATFTGKYGRK